MTTTALSFATTSSMFTCDLKTSDTGAVYCGTDATGSGGSSVVWNSYLDGTLAAPTNTAQTIAVGGTDFSAPLLFQPTGILLNVASTTALNVQKVNDQPAFTVNTGDGSQANPFATTTAYGYFRVATTSGSIDTPALFVAPNGNVGIGTSSPYANLSIKSANTNTTGLAIDIGGAGTTYGIDVWGTPDYGMRLANAGTASITTEEDAHLVLEAAGLGDIIFKGTAGTQVQIGNYGTAISDRFVLNALNITTDFVSGQHITFDTNADAAADTNMALYIQANSGAELGDNLYGLYFEGGGLGAGNEVGIMFNWGSDWDTDISTLNNTDLTLSANGTGNVTIQGDADTGLKISAATTDITTGLHEDLTISANGTGDIVFQLDSDTPAYFSGGNIGIATTTPGGTYGERLTIDGGIYATHGVTTTALSFATTSSMFSCTLQTSATGAVFCGSSSGGGTFIWNSYLSGTLAAPTNTAQTIAVGGTDFSAPLLFQPTGILLNVASTTALNVQKVNDTPAFTVNTGDGLQANPFATTTAYGYFRVATTSSSIDTPAFFVDGATGRVGIGTSTPLFLVHAVKSSTGISDYATENTSAVSGSWSAFTAGEDLSGAATNFVQTMYSNSGNASTDLLRLASSGVLRTGSSASGGLVLVSANSTAPIIFGTGGVALTNERMRISSAGFVGIATTTPFAPLTLQGTASGSGANSVAGIFASTTLANTTGSGFQFGNRFITNVTGGTAGTLEGIFVRVLDHTSVANTVYGMEIQASSGGNTSGTNTGLLSFGKTFGVQGVTLGTAGGVLEPAGLYGENKGTTQGNALRLYSSTMTTATSMASFYQESSPFSGTGLLMNLGKSGGDFTGNFVDFQDSDISRFSVGYGGTTTIVSMANNSSTDVFLIKANIQGAAAVDTKFKVRSDGQIFSDSGTTVTLGADLAEMTQVVGSYLDYPDGTLVSLVASSSSGKLVEKTVRPYQSSMLGVVTNRGTFLGGLIGASDDTMNLDEEQVQAKYNTVKVGLVGYVKVRVSNINGAVIPGDPLTSSPIAGVAMRATRGGRIIGLARETFGAGATSTIEGLIEASVSTQWNTPDGTMALDVDNFDLTASGQLQLTNSKTGSSVSVGTSTAALLIRQSAVATTTLANLLQVQAGGEDRLLLGSYGQLSLNSDVDCADLPRTDNCDLVVVRNNGSQQFAITATGTVQLAGDLIVAGTAQIAGHIHAGSDVAGQVILATGATATTTYFKTPYTQTPIISLTPNGRVGSEFWKDVVYSHDVDPATTTDAYLGFTVNIEQPTTHDIVFDYIIVGTDEKVVPLAVVRAAVGDQAPLTVQPPPIGDGGTGTTDTSGTTSGGGTGDTTSGTGTPPSDTTIPTSEAVGTPTENVGADTTSTGGDTTTAPDTGTPPDSGTSTGTDSGTVTAPDAGTTDTSTGTAPAPTDTTSDDTGTTPPPPTSQADPGTVIP